MYSVNSFNPTSVAQPMELNTTQNPAFMPGRARFNSLTVAPALNAATHQSRLQQVQPWAAPDHDGWLASKLHHLNQVAQADKPTLATMKFFDFDTRKVPKLNALVRGAPNIQPERSPMGHAEAKVLLAALLNLVKHNVNPCPNTSNPIKKQINYPLHLALLRSAPMFIIQFFIDQGHPLHETHDYAKDVYLLAMSTGNREAVRALHAHDPTIFKSSLQRPFFFHHFAAHASPLINTPMVEELFNHCTAYGYSAHNLNRCDQDEKTAFDRASRKSNQKLVDLFHQWIGNDATQHPIALRTTTPELLLENNQQNVATQLQGQPQSAAATVQPAQVWQARELTQRIPNNVELPDAINLVAEYNIRTAASILVDLSRASH